MAVVVHDLGLIFFLSPGTGSTSLSKYFLDNFDSQWVLNEKQGKHAIPDEVVAAGYRLADYLCVTTTRNPFDFYISQYQKKRTWKGDDEWLTFARANDFSAFLQRSLSETPEGLLHSIYLNASDVVFRKERLQDDVREFLAAIGCKADVVLPTENVSEDLDHNNAVWYSEAQMDAVEIKHRSHLARFGYDRDRHDPSKHLDLGSKARTNARRLGSFMVLEGSDDWLYLSNASNHVVDHAMGLYSVQDRWLTAWHQALSERIALAKFVGGKYAHFVVPNTHSAVPANLPTGTVVTNQRPADLLTTHLQGLPFLDLTPFFRKQEARACFVPTDSHWSNYGAYLGYRETCRYLGVESFCFEIEDFEWQSAQGDLGVKMTPKRSSAFLTIKPAVFAETCGPIQTLLSNHVEVTGKFRVFQAEKPLVKDRILIFGDSYTYSNLSLFAATFAETYFLHTKSFDRTLVHALRPNYVISVNCERFILDPPQTSDAKEYAAEYLNKLHLDKLHGVNHPAPALDVTMSNAALARVLPLFSGFEETYDKYMNRNDVTIRRIQDLYTILLRRVPPPEHLLDKWLRQRSLKDLVNEFVQCDEFRLKSK